MRNHPVLTDLAVAAVVTVILLSLASGPAMVGIALVALALGRAGTQLLRRYVAHRRAARRTALARSRANGTRGSGLHR
ncbi:MAG: hypothetical protein JOZ07_01165 [Solirubrobacterales bacterium]|nr:hypothetical protein [Solirubrobacterales bacterium]